jgi:hypothetical protein
MPRRVGRSLAPGQEVRFRWETPGQDGCDARAVDVWSSPDADTGVHVEPASRPRGGYASGFETNLDDPPDGSPPPSP